MSKRLGPIDLVCDSPPYPIVKACHLVGLAAPEDVRWCRLSSHLVEHAGWGEVARMFSWPLMPTERPFGGARCSCKSPLPRLRRCLFTTSGGQSYSYLLGQCPRCRTIFWEDGDEGPPE